MSCPNKKPIETWLAYCKANPSCDRCRCPEVIKNGSPRLYGRFCNEVIRNGSPRLYTMAYEEDQQKIAEQFQEEFDTFSQTLPPDSIERHILLAEFYGNHGLAALRAHALDEACLRADSSTALSLNNQLSMALHDAGFLEAAVETSRYAPLILKQLQQEQQQLLNISLQNKALALEALGRTTEAESNRALARILMTNQSSG